jgi:hypothetical protein
MDNFSCIDRSGRKSMRRLLRTCRIELSLHRFVDSHEQVKMSLGKPEEFAVFITSPSRFRHRLNSVSGQVLLKARRQALV